MKNTVYLISNEKIFQNNEMFFCDNLDMKSTPEGLNKHFDVKIIARKSKVNRFQKLMPKINKSNQAVIPVLLKEMLLRWHMNKHQ